MTGYGEHRTEYNGMDIAIEMRSVNNRYLDIVTKLPRTFSHLEIDIKKIVQSYFKRGRIEVYLSLSGDIRTNKTLHIDWDLLDQLMNQLRLVQEKYALSGSIPIETITMMDGVFSIDDQGIDTSTLDSLLKETIHSVCHDLRAHRTSEGAFLMEDIENKLAIVKELIYTVRANQQTIAKQYRQRILERITEHLDNTATVDPSSLIKDVAILAEKGDITEEITRLSSHVEHFQSVIVKDNIIGRKLDFITQEMHREVNTIGAKSVDPELSTIVVKLKSEIEKIKEQIQNIE